MRCTALVAALALLLLAVPLVAADQAETRTWLVGTRGTPQVQALAKSHPDGEVTGFQSFRGYAAVMTEAQAAELRKSPDVRFVEPDYERTLYAPVIELGPKSEGASEGGVAPTAQGQTVPYGVDLVQARRVWEFARGRKIRVGVVDTGIDHYHPDFQKVYSGRSRTTRRPLGFDFVNNDADPMDDHGHGTHVAGTIAALDNAFGVVGVAPDIDIYALKVLRPSASGEATGSVSSIIKAIDWAIENDLHILNLSLGSDQQSTAEKEAFARAWDAGILSIAATGNGYSGVDGIGFPAAYPDVIAVGATDETNTIASFSQRGTQMGLVAPGVGVFSTLPIGSSELAEVQVGQAEPLAAVTLEGSPLAVVSGPWVFAGLGKPEELSAAVAGKIAVIRRGELFFRDKAKNAKDAGATAVVIINNLTGLSEFNGTLRPINQNTGQPMFPEDASYAFPLTVGISQEDGEALLLGNPGSILTVSSTRYDYGTLQGTSMATPHVTGVAALIWSLSPNATAEEVRNALFTGAKDLGVTGWDSVYGWGLADAWGAASAMAPEVLAGGGGRP